MKEKILKILNKEEVEIFNRLNTPQKIQDFLDTIKFNFEVEGETYMSPRMVLKTKKAHCFEAAVLSFIILRFHKFQSFLIDLKVKNLKKDSDHCVCVFKQNGYWGAISKTNHAILRWRDPIYKTIRELALSYFHEYFIPSGEKTLLSFSKPFNPINKFGLEWVADKNDLDRMAQSLDNFAHVEFIPSQNVKFIRKASKTEIKASNIVEWKN